jgi:hypothetical protein
MDALEAAFIVLKIPEMIVATSSNQSSGAYLL